MLFVSSMSIQTLIPHLCVICLHEKERQRAVAFRVIGDLLVSGTTLQREEILLGGFIKK